MAEGQKLSQEEANALTLEHQGWAESIARSVARAWNMDWKLDGLDGAAMEALIFCSRRFEPARGIPFRGYARKRIHEASTEQARRSRGWRRGLGTSSRAEQQAREVSAELFNIFPELRSGELPLGDDDGGSGDGVRGAIQGLLVGASIIAARQSMESTQPDELVDVKRTITIMALLELVHQLMMWKIYWEGTSMRSVADEWQIDELNIIREHKVLLAFLLKSIQKGKALGTPKVRPGLKEISLRLRKSQQSAPFSAILKRGASDG